MITLQGMKNHNTKLLSKFGNKKLKTIEAISKNLISHKKVSLIVQCIKKFTVRLKYINPEIQIKNEKIVYEGKKLHTHFWG